MNISDTYFKKGLNLEFKKINDNAQLPVYQTDGAAGFDLCCLESFILESGERILVSTGLQVEIPIGFEIQIRPRSGLALKYGITVLNSPGTIDSDYRGEIKVILINHGKEDVAFQHGDRIAQGVLNKIERPNMILVSDELSQTERGSNGFGSTGN